MTTTMHTLCRTAVAVGLLTLSVHAADSTVAALEKRLARLEARVAAQQQTIEDQAERIRALTAPVTAAEPAPGRPEAEQFPVFDEADARRLRFSGVLEAEAGYTRTDANTGDMEASDMVLATFELGVEGELNDWISGAAVLLWEEDDTEPVDLDTAAIRLGNPEQFPVFLDIGRMYMPFGRFATSFVSDPLTVDLGETRESVARVGLVRGPFALGMSVFNGDVNETGDRNDHIEDVVVDAAFEWADESTAVAIGAAWISNLADSDGLQDAVADNARGGTLADDVAGVSVWTAVSYGPASLVAEYLAALDDLPPNSLSFGGPGNDWVVDARPRTFNIEAAWVLNERFAMAGRYEHAEDAFDWLPEQRYGGVGRYLLHDGDRGTATLALEYLHGTYDDAAATSEDALTLQLALEF